MIDQLESDLRSALHERAAQVPAASAARLTRLDYRPRTRVLKPPVAIGALAGAAGTAGAVVALVSLGTGAANAFAGWTSTPTPPSPTQLAAAGADCQKQSPIAGLPLVLTDTRGPFTFEIYANDRESAECISGPSFTSVSGSMSSAPLKIPAGKVLLASSHRTTRVGQAYSFAEGHTGSGVTAVKLILDDGAPLEATVQNDWFVAWWPSAHEVKTAEVTTPAGVTTQNFDLRHESPCGAHLCTGGAIGRGTNGPVTGQVSGGTNDRGSSTGAGAGASFNITR
jgi:hypothetical protein